MNRFFRLFPALVVLLASAGCATDPGVRAGWTLSDADFNQLKPGMSQAQVAKIIGNPPMKMTFARQQEEVWDYAYIETHFRLRSSVYFDMRGVMKYHTREMDQVYYGCGC